MALKPAFWYPVAIGLSIVNVVAVWFAARPPEPLHAALHAGLAVAFGLWAQRLKQGRGAGQLGAGLEALEIDVQNLRQELSETQERLDFAERLLATKGQQSHRSDHP